MLILMLIGLILKEGRPTKTPEAIPINPEPARPLQLEYG
jgi:hypothetical protein